jgi:hypothetical protein
MRKSKCSAFNAFRLRHPFSITLKHLLVETYKIEIINKVNQAPTELEMLYRVAERYGYFQNGLA